MTNNLELINPNATSGNRLGEVTFGNLDGGSAFSASARIRGYRDGADNSTGLSFWNTNAGTIAVKMTITSAGKVQIGGTDDQALLNVTQSDNSYTGLETMPTLRMIWNYQRNQSYWFALSRNVRSPSRSDRDLVLPNNPPYYVIADNDFQSETAQTLQLGWKALIQDNTYLNFTVFYTSYKKLHAAILEDTQYTLVNGLDANTHGVEFWGSMQLLDQWKVKAGATFVDEDFEYRENAGPFLNMNENAPVTQFSVQSQYDLTPSLELDFYYRYVGQLAYSDVPSSDFLDVRLAWWPVSDIELSIKGTNLLSSHQIEYRAVGQNDHYFERNFKLGIRWYP